MDIGLLTGFQPQTTLLQKVKSTQSYAHNIADIYRTEILICLIK